MGEIKERYGQGASLIRKPWTPRGQSHKHVPRHGSVPEPRSAHDATASSGDVPVSAPHPTGTTQKRSRSSDDESDISSPIADDADEELLESISALSLVPRQLRDTP